MCTFRLLFIFNSYNDSFIFQITEYIKCRKLYHNLNAATVIPGIQTRRTLKEMGRINAWYFLGNTKNTSCAKSIDPCQLSPLLCLSNREQFKMKLNEVIYSRHELWQLTWFTCQSNSAFSHSETLTHLHLNLARCWTKYLK